MDKWQALQSFWSDYGIPAYDENSVFSGMEDSPTMPYITYEAAIGDISSDILLSASIWYKSTSWAAISQKAEEISADVEGGKIIPYDNGALWIKKGQPFAQRMSEPSDDKVRRMYLNIEAQFLSV